jgi:hypothetical protein
MGLDLGSIISSVASSFKLPDLSTIGSDILTEGKDLLGQVVKDSFTLSNKPGETFADNMNLNVAGANISLPNPLGSLANKLLGDANSFTSKFGVNLDFKTMLGNLFHLPTQSGGTVAVPPVSQRALPTAQTVAGAGGGGGTSATASTSTASTAATSTASAPATTSSVSNSSDPFTSAASSLTSGIGDLNKQITDTINDQSMDPSEKQAKLMQFQQQEQSLNECLSLLSNIMQDEHQSRMNTINNIKG